MQEIHYYVKIHLIDLNASPPECHIVYTLDIHGYTVPLLDSITLWSQIRQAGFEGQSTGLSYLDGFEPAG